MNLFRQQKNYLGFYYFRLFFFSKVLIFHFLNLLRIIILRVFQRKSEATLVGRHKSYLKISVKSQFDINFDKISVEKSLAKTIPDTHTKFNPNISLNSCENKLYSRQKKYIFTKINKWELEEIYPEEKN